MNVDNLQTFGEFDLWHEKGACLLLIDHVCSTWASCLDPLQDDLLGETDDVGSQSEHIHIRIQQRNGRKTLTTLQGLGKGMFTSLSVDG